MKTYPGFNVFPTFIIHHQNPHLNLQGRGNFEEGNYIHQIEEKYKPNGYIHRSSHVYEHFYIILDQPSPRLYACTTP